jgi:ATP-dependent DNA helicase RecQ
MTTDGNGVRFFASSTAPASSALDITGYGTWRVTDAGRRVLKGAERITLRNSSPDAKRPGRRPIPRPELAKEQRVAAYVAFADKTLIEVARRKPRTAVEIAAVQGVGEAKLRQYGDIFLDVIRQHGADSTSSAA